MEIPWATLSSAWAAASAIAVLGIGLVFLRDRDAQPRGGLAFGLFAVAWGLQITGLHLGSLVNNATAAQYLFLASVVGDLPLAYFLVEFGAAYARSDARSPLWRTLRWGTGGLGILGAILLAVEPSLIFKGVQSTARGFEAVWGSFYWPLFSSLSLLAFPVVLVTLEFWTRDAPTDRTKRFASNLAIGVALYTGYNAANNLPFFLPELVASPWSTGGFFGVVVLAIVAVCGVLGFHAIQRSRRSSRDPEQRRNRWLAAAYLGPMVWGLGEALLVYPNPDIYTVGLWRLATVAVIAYGIARWRDYALPRRLRRRASDVAGGSGALAAGATAYGAGTLLSSGLALPLIAGVGTTGLTALPAVRWARRLFGADEDNPVDAADDLYEQRIETYRAALEDAMARGTLDEDEPFLTDLRERFDITDREDRILRYYARKATIPHREGDPNTAYERLRILGEGGAARTWLARDRSRDRLVVLKEPLEQWHDEPAVLEAARREARLAAKVRHPNVVEVEEVLEDDGRPVLVMEHVTGGSLGDKLRNEGTLEPREVIRIVHDVAEGLAAVHDAGLVHRDLTPDNVLLTGDGRARITDFGLARPQGGTGTQLLDAEAGTRGYRAPEAACGDDAPTVDVFGCAALLHTCLYGSPPVEGTVRVEAEVPEALQHVVETGLSPDPNDRFGDAQEMADVLEELVEP